MEAKELLLGSIIYSKGQNIKDGQFLGWKNYETKVTIEVLQHILNNNTDYKYSPITLTEEWLLKFGFEQMKDSTTYEWKDGDYRSIQVDLKSNEAEIYLCGYDYAMSSQCFPIDHIQYIHQIQNLFYSLNGKELNLK
nr:hypothetical protein [uncultured Chryseobacterium sp.]